MPSTYCSSCGHKMDYTLQKPKFCSECGQSLATLKPSVAKQVEPDPPEDNIENYHNKRIETIKIYLQLVPLWN